MLMICRKLTHLKSAPLGRVKTTPLYSASGTRQQLAGIDPPPRAATVPRL